MSEEKQTGRISRREFLKDAGLIVGGATIGSIALVNACGTRTTTVPGDTATVTTTVPGSTTTVTTTVTQPGSTITATPTNPALGDESLVSLTINGTLYNLTVKNHLSLAWVLREKLGLFGTKIACDMGQCGACTILVDDVPAYGCVMLACEANGKKIATIEGLSDGITLSAIQQRFYDKEAVQCGYCTPGFIMAAAGLLKVNSRPPEDDVRLALSGHICMCQNFRKTINAIVGGV